MRVKGGPKAHRRHKKILKLAKGYHSRHRTNFKLAKESVTHAGVDAYIDRRKRKRDFRGLWITRINAGVRAEGLSYSVFINGLQKAKIKVNRKMLADLAVRNPDVFKAIAAEAKKSS